MKKHLKIPKSFVGFLIISTIIWLTINLSKQYLVRYNLPVTYLNFTQDKILQNTPISSLDVDIKATGFQLFTGSFSKLKVKIPVGNIQKKSKGNYYLLTSSLKDTVQSQLPKGFSLKTIYQDSIEFKLGVLQSKKVPLKPNLSVSYKPGFNATQIKIVPDSLIVSGASSQLDSINYVSLKEVVLENLASSYNDKLPIVMPEVKNIKLSHKEAQVQIELAKFTEGSFDVSVFVKGIAPKNITIFPKIVKVFYKVQLEDFDKVTPASFEVVADYKYAKENHLNFLLPELKSKSAYVSSVRIVPQKLDYLIHK